MDKKMKHRILGVLVVIGLVIILLPFLQNEKGLPSEKTLLKAPPFPDQAVQVTTSSTEPTEPQIPIAVNNSSEADNAINQQPDDTIRVVRPSVINAKVPELTGAIPSTNVNGNNDSDDKMLADQNSTKAIELPTAESSDEDIQAQMIHGREIVDPDIVNKRPQKTLHLVKQSIETQIGKIKPFIPQFKSFTPDTRSVPKPQSLSASLDKNGLAKLQNAAWVIQLGSFKNKANALRLVNQLRANGYNAFIQEVSTSFGDSTRVFVGPETKHTAAREIASQLETDLHLHGIVISYKPLSL